VIWDISLRHFLTLSMVCHRIPLWDLNKSYRGVFYTSETLYELLLMMSL
jgi:hypothetical protein